MQKVFLSHSSKDKESYVRIVADKLIKKIGPDAVIVDELTFEEGCKTLDEIKKCLGETDLFVVFLSNDSLESEWVKEEIFKAKKLWDDSHIKQICPVIIKEEIKYDDPRIPEWLRENYNLKYVSRPTKAASIIEGKMIELSYNMHPRLKERNEIFVGRNSLIDKFEERMDDLDKSKPVCIIASGIPGIGRRALIKHCIFKSNLKKSSYPFPQILLNYSESIEDFILKIYDLGFTEKTDLTNLLTMEMHDKVRIAISLISDLQRQKEILFIDDNGALIDHDGRIADWFSLILEEEGLEAKLTICVSAKFRYRIYNDNNVTKERLFSLSVDELEKKEREGLLSRCLEFENLELDKEDIRFIARLLSGFPEQVFFSVEMLKRDGLSSLKKNSYEIIDFNSKKASLLLREFEEDDDIMSFLTMLASFDCISLNYIGELVDKNEKYLKYINKFLSIAICEYVGTLKEYIRVNETIRDYISRNDFKISEQLQKNMDENLRLFLQSPSLEEYEVPEYLFSLKEALIKGKTIDSSCIIPSLYLKTMTELYNKGKNKDVISFADKALESERYMDEAMIFEIRYLLCSALAKQKDRRFHNEVIHIKSPADRFFLYGFFYRQVGKFDKAIYNLNKSLVERKNFSKAKRELVAAYIGMQDYQTATELAKDNYTNYKDNAYHIQAYFSCLIKGTKSFDNRKILESLIYSLETIKTDIAREMTKRCKAQLYAFYDDNQEEALRYINEAIEMNNNIQYARIVKFDICEKFNMISEMEEIVKYFEQPEYKNKYSNIIVIFKSILMALDGKVSEAVDYYCSNIRDYTEQAKENFINKLQRYGETPLSH